MGYLNNTTRTLDAILTRKGREMLARGQLLNINKFALGDDEVDYALWDTSHQSGTDYYGAIIENLPFLEPFDDPDTIMKYKLVTRTEGTRTMPYIESSPTTSVTELAVNYDHNYELSENKNATHFWENSETDGPHYFVTVPITGFTVATKDIDTGTTGQTLYAGENYSLTILDVSAAFIGPQTSVLDSSGYYGLDSALVTVATTSNPITVGYQAMKEVQSVTQTINNVVVVAGNLTVNGTVLNIYGKSLTSGTAKTKLIITGVESGAVYEYNITITYV